MIFKGGVLMNRAVAFFAAFASVTGGTVHAQGVDFTQMVSLQDPRLMVTVTPLPASDPWCSSYSFPTNPGCVGEVAGEIPRPIGVDSVGRSYRLTGQFSLSVASPETVALLYRELGDAPLTSLATIYTRRCIDAVPYCTPNYLFAATLPWVDPVAGNIMMVAAGCVIPSGAGGCDLRAGAALVTISGLPKMFDTLLTFVPPGQTISLLTPTHPDGFRSADSLQLWAGDVRTLPDWSQATAVSCVAAATPKPGQLVSVADTLPDPAVGPARYYVVASQNGPQRRLGREYVNGALSARDPAVLPVCQ